MRLNQLSDNPGARKARMRVGRGIGSGKGKTAGRGGKGQTARTGVAINGFEGGQMPLHMRMPKRGFNNVHRLDYVEVNVGRLQEAIDAGRLAAGATVDGAAMVTAGVIRRQRDGVRLLAKGEIKAKLVIKVAGASKAAIAAVEKAGGSVEVKAPKKPAPEAALRGSGREGVTRTGRSTQVGPKWHPLQSNLPPVSISAPSPRRRSSRSGSGSRLAP